MRHLVDNGADRGLEVAGKAGQHFLALLGLPLRLIGLLRRPALVVFRRVLADLKNGTADVADLVLAARCLDLGTEITGGDRIQRTDQGCQRTGDRAGEEQGDDRRNRDRRQRPHEHLIAHVGHRGQGFFDTLFCRNRPFLPLEVQRPRHHEPVDAVCAGDDLQRRFRAGGGRQAPACSRFSPPALSAHLATSGMSLSKTPFIVDHVNLAGLAEVVSDCRNDVVRETWLSRRTTATPLRLMAPKEFMKTGDARNRDPSPAGP